MEQMKPEELRAEIFRKVEEYYQLVHAPQQQAAFVPGESRVHYGGRVFDQDELLNLVDASLEFWLTYGRYSRQFEKQFAEFLAVPFALLVNSGSSANLLAFMTLTSPLLGERQVRRGDEVITVAAGFPTTVSPIIQYGAVPVFVDVEESTANLDPALLEKAFSAKSKAVLLAHTLGNPFNLHAVKDFCDRHGLWLIEDNCDALGSKYDGKLTGTLGDMGTSSFYPPHHLTLGEGGALYTSNPLLKKIAMSLRDWGRDCCCEPGVDNSCGCRFTGKFGQLPHGYDHKYVFSHFGFNLRATDMQAAVGCVQLKKFPQFMIRRKENYQRLYQGLYDLPQFQFCEKYPESDPCWFGFLMTVKPQAVFSRNEIVCFLEKSGIQTRNLFAGNLTKHPCFESLKAGSDYRIATPLVNTDRFMNDAFWIGLYPGLDQPRIDYMISKIREFCGSNTSV